MVSAVYRGDKAKPSVQTCTCVHRTCNGYGVTGDRYGVGQSHPWCDPCYTLSTLQRLRQQLLTTATKVEVDGQTIHLSQRDISCTGNEVGRWAVPQETRYEGQGV